MFDFMLVMIIEAPNRPESNGSSGSDSNPVSPREKTNIPNIPVKRKIRVAWVFLFSEKIKKMEDKIKRYGISV